MTQTDSPTALLSQVAEKVATISDITEQQNITGCLGILAGLRFEKDLIRQFLREEVMQQSVIYQDIWERSRKAEAVSLILRQVNRRFPEVDSSLIERVNILSVEQLEEFGESLFDFSNVSDLQAYLTRQSA